MKKGMLTVVAGAVTGGIVGGIGALSVSKTTEKIVKEKEKKVEKFKEYYNILNQWLILKQENKTIDTYFIENKYNTIAIYGMGEMGNRLYTDLKDTKIEVKYAIDKNADYTYSDLNVFEINDTLQPVDAVIVTATFAFDKISEELEKYVDCPIISLEEVIYEI